MIETAEAPRRPSSVLRSSFTTMLFKRKPVDTAPTTSKPVEKAEKEVRQRHRLSKPQTSKSSTNLAILATQQSASQSMLSVLSDTPMSSVASTPATEERRVSEKPRPISTVHEEGPMIDTESDDIAWHGAAVVINAVENTQRDRNSASPVPLPVQKPRRPFSAMIFGSRRSSNSHTVFRNFSFEEAPRSREVSTSSKSPATLVEVVIEGAPRVLERRASFTPGAATRISKIQPQDAPFPARKPIPQPRNEPTYELADPGQLCEAEKSYYYDKTRSPISPLSQIEVLDFEKDWEPPPQIARSATPSDLDYHSLGGLRLGSLHVTNGRASPAPSDFPRPLRHRPSALLRRDASSEYGSEVGSIRRTHTPPPSAWKQPQSREVSQSRKFSPSQAQPQISRDVSYGSENTFTAWSHAKGTDLPSPTADRTTSMAMSYMAEMPNSPFSPLASQSNSPLAPQRSSSPTGSVLVSTKKSEHEAELFDDETVGESQGSDEDRDTISTCRTPSDAASHRVNPFATYNKLRDRPSQGHLQPPQDARGETSDSGYSSNASLQSAKEEKLSLVAQRVNAFEQPRTESAAAQIPATIKKANEDKMLGPRPFRASILKFHRKTAPESVPTMAGFSQSTTSVATSQATTSTTSSRPKTPSKKLQKKRRASQPAPPEEIMVMGARPEDESPIPPIPQHQSANLMVRSQQFPELQRTFKSHHHTKDSASSLDQPFKPMDIKFPSPPPESTSDDEDAGRSKSPSPKRSSFIDRATRRQSLESRKSVGRPSSGIGEAEAQAIIQHFGTTANSLGGSPYDIAKAANSRPQSRSASREGRITPHNISATPSPAPDHRRLTMDDRTASEFARSKSKSIAERDRQDSVENLKRLENEKRTAVNDMAGVPGKRPRPHSVQPGLMATITRKPLDGERSYHVPQRPPARQQDTRPAEPADQNWPEPQQHWHRHQNLAPQPENWAQQQRHLPFDAPASLPARHCSPADRQQDVQRYESPAPESRHWPEERQLSRPPQSPVALPSRPSPRPEQAQYSQHNETPAPLPPRHSPRPSFLEPHDDIDEMELPPPPPSHSPRPMDLPTSESAQDIWAAQAQAWKNRRKSVGEFLGFNSDDLHCDNNDQHSAYSDEAVVEEDLYPVIPPRESQTAYTPHDSHTPYTSRPNVWQPAAHHHAMTYEPDMSRMTPAETFQDPAAYPYSQQEQYQESPRPLPKPRSRRTSGHSQAHSYASSLAEELHPDKDERPVPPHDFGRYSGGLQYGYEKNKGFGGSAGTRTVSGKAEASRKGMPLSADFGVDLSDVPIIAGMKRL